MNGISALIRSDMSKDGLFNKWFGENWTDICKKMKLDNLLTQCTRINSKWVKDLNVKFKTIKILEENISSKILGISHSNIFSYISPRARKQKEK